MRKQLTHTLLMVVQAVCVFEVARDTQAADPIRTPGNDENSMAAKANNNFACDLYRKLAVREGDLFFSPTSISSVLGMLEVGAKGATKSELRTAMHIADSNEAPNGFIRLLERPTDGSRLKFANGIWGAKGLDFNSDYRKAVQDQFSGDFEEVDFADPLPTLERINDWVDDKTNGKIPKLFSTPFKPDVKLVATNAIYFKGNWTHRFDPKRTQSKKFFGRGQKQIDVPTMVVTNRFRYWDSRALLKAIELPYEGDVFSAVVLLPTNRDGLPELEKQLTSENLQSWISNVDGSIDPKTKEPPEVQVQLPKFTLSAELQLNETLQQLGIKAIFGTSADLTGIASEPLFLSTVIHKSFVQVDEKGTVATAATGGAVSASIPPVFAVDHPFLFLIRDRKSGAILFLGRVENPSHEAAPTR